MSRAIPRGALALCSLLGASVAAAGERTVVAQGAAELAPSTADDPLARAGVGQLRVGFRFTRDEDTSYRRVDLMWSPSLATCPRASLRSVSLSALVRFGERAESVALVVDSPAEAPPDTLLRGATTPIGWADVLPPLTSDDARTAFALGFTVTGIAVRAIELDTSACTSPSPTGVGSTSPGELPPVPPLAAPPAPPAVADVPPTRPEATGPTASADAAAAAALIAALKDRAVLIDTPGESLRGILLGGDADKLLLALPSGELRTIARPHALAIRLDGPMAVSTDEQEALPAAVPPLAPAAAPMPRRLQIASDVESAPDAPTNVAEVAGDDERPSVAADAGKEPAPGASLGPLLLTAGGIGVAAGLAGVTSGIFVWGGPGATWGGAVVGVAGVALVIAGVLVPTTSPE